MPRRDKEFAALSAAGNRIPNQYNRRDPLDCIAPRKREKAVLPEPGKTALKLVGVTRFELATPRPPDVCSNRTELHPVDTTLTDAAKVVFFLIVDWRRPHSFFFRIAGRRATAN